MHGGGQGSPGYRPQNTEGPRREILEGKIAVVTGASSGIGESVARLFAKEGAKLTQQATAGSYCRKLPHDAFSESAPTVGAFLVYGRQEFGPIGQKTCTDLGC